MPIDFEVLAYDETSLGILCLRRRLTLAEPKRWITEVTLNHEFLMSSLHTDSERALATHAIERASGDNLQVLVGGLGLGYTASAALSSQRVGKVQVVELLPQVMQWMDSGLIPLSEHLKQDVRLTIVESDIYKLLLSDPSQQRWDVILIDVDHSPADQLSADEHGFYSQTGLALVVRHLRAAGVLALWSYENNRLLECAMREVFESIEIFPVSYENQHVNETFTDWLFIGKIA